MHRPTLQVYSYFDVINIHLCKSDCNGSAAEAIADL